MTRDPDEVHMNTVMSDIEYYYSKYLESVTDLQEIEKSYFNGEDESG